MANCHQQFITYRSNLDIPRTTFDRLKTAQYGVEKQLRKYFDKREGYNVKGFKVQGSKSISTMIRKQGDTVDIDFGIYFYPKPNVQPGTLIERVYDALYDLRTTYAPTRKNKCVRVVYREESKIHIDVPIFYLEQLRGERNPQLATRNGWVSSDATEFEVWYKENKGSRNVQLTHIIRYLKGWATHYGQEFEMPKGVAMTVLAAIHHEKQSRDDIAFLETIISIRQTLKKDFSCKMPVKPHDDLLRNINTSPKRQAFLRLLDALIEDGEIAVKTTSKEKAVQLWRKHLGKYFPAY